MPSDPSGPRVVAIGGGHGLAATLTALRLIDVTPTAIVSVADDGGSSGRLRRDLGILPPGDLRMALLALATVPAPLTELFAYRFHDGDVAGHNLGNLLVAALTDLQGGFLTALETASRLLGVRGQVLPSTLDLVRLAGRVGRREVHGQVALAHTEGRIERVWLEPGDPAPVPAAVTAVEQADLVLLGPGSTFSSVVPNLLVPELGQAVARAARRVVYVCNLVPQQGETDGFTPETHVRTLLDHCPGLRLAQVLCQQPAEPSLAARDVRELGRLGTRPVHADIADGFLPGRHDPTRLAAALKPLVG